MDLNEAAERIFKYHWVLILVVTLLGVAVPVALAQLEDEQYAAAARIAIGAEDARDIREANSLADTALATATSPAIYDQALAAAGVDPDADEAPSIQVQPVGTSGVLQLTVTHPDAATAATIANSLAELVVAQRTQSLLGDTEALLAQTDEQITQLTEAVAALGVEAEEAARAEAAARVLGQVPTSTLDAVTLRYRQAVDQLAAAQGQRQDLAATLAQVSRPEVVDASATEGTLLETSLPARLAVGALLGLILGVALAATLEAFRPTLSAAGLARHLDVPLLGRLKRLPERSGILQDKWLASYVSLAADGAGVRSFELVPVGPDVDVTALARTLARETEGGGEIVPLALNRPHDQRLPEQLTSPGTGLIVVAPDRVKSSWLEHLERHVRLTRQPVIGVIAYGGRPRRPAAQEAEAAEPAPSPASSGATATANRRATSPANSAASAPARAGVHPDSGSTAPATS